MKICKGTEWGTPKIYLKNTWHILKTNSQSKVREIKYTRYNVSKKLGTITLKEKKEK